MLKDFSDIRRAILLLLKREQALSIAELAERLEITYEGIRQQTALLEEERWIEKKKMRRTGGRAGRPVSRYSLTTAGDQLFPKHYDLLAVTLIEAARSEFGDEGFRRLLASLTEAQAAKWEPLLRGKNLKERLYLLKDLYLEDDPFMEVEEDDGLRLIERNCPYLNVALHHPGLCSLTVSVLTRLLGVDVVREERFQNGDRRCTFRVYPDRPVTSPSFRFESERKDDSRE